MPAGSGEEQKPLLAVPLEAERRQFCEYVNGRYAAIYLSEPVGSVNKGDCSQICGIQVALGVPYINRRSQLIAHHEISDIFTFRLAVAALPLKILKIVIEFVDVQKSFDITFLAIADDKQIVLPGQSAKCFFQMRI